MPMNTRVTSFIEKNDISHNKTSPLLA